MPGFTNILLSQGSRGSISVIEDDPDFGETFMLLHSEFDQLYDVTGFPALNVVGSGVVSTDQAKFGTQSFYNPGTAASSSGLDYVSVQGSGSPTDFEFPGDFTWEGWFYINSQQDNFMNIFTNNIAFPATGYMQVARADSTNALFVNFSGVGSGSGPLLPLGEWLHIAIVREGTSIAGFVNGVGQVMVTGGATVGGSNLGISTFDIGRAIAADNGDLDAYFEEIRVSKVARYSLTGSPLTLEIPTAPFPPYPGL